MLWDGTKFLTEKLVGAIVRQALKLLFVTLTFMLAINGFLALMVRPFDNFIDQTIYTLFTIFLHWLLCQNGPALATALLTGTPQLSMAEGLRTAASMAGAAAAVELPLRVQLLLESKPLYKGKQRLIRLLVLERLPPLMGKESLAQLQQVRARWVILPKSL
ncbi:hypothetical protein [Teretinema zuelzerae]|nr:hypothetical protein [Teretinema zuelzerae]